MSQKTKSGELVDQLQTLLLNATIAGVNVFVARTWPVRLGEVPILIVDPIYTEQRQALGNNSPQFSTTTTVRIRGRVTAKADVDDTGALACRDDLELMKFEIERTLINSNDLMTLIENFPAIDTEFAISSEGEQPVGELRMAIAMAFYEGPEDFAPIETTTLEEVNIYPDLTNVFDPDNNYSDTPFTADPPPRTSGPDGRIEGGALHIDTDPDS